MSPDALNWLDPTELDQLHAESIGWIPLEDGAYLHAGDAAPEAIEVVGVPSASMAGITVLLLG